MFGAVCLKKYKQRSHQAAEQFGICTQISRLSITLPMIPIAIVQKTIQSVLIRPRKHWLYTRQLWYLTSIQQKRALVRNLDRAGPMQPKQSGGSALAFESAERRLDLLPDNDSRPARRDLHPSRYVTHEIPYRGPKLQGWSVVRRTSRMTKGLFFNAFGQIVIRLLKVMDISLRCASRWRQ